MDEQQILAEVGQGEDVDWEFKSAKGGLPGSLWETYSAMANTDGGVIVLGVRQKGDCFEVHGLDDARKMRGDFWSTINNRGKVSINLLDNEGARIANVSGEGCPRRPRAQGDPQGAARVRGPEPLGRNVSKKLRR